MECNEIISNYNILIAVVSTISAFISALMAYFSNSNAQKSKSIAYASLLAPHFDNVRDVLHYVHWWNGLSANILEDKKKSIIFLKSMLQDDKELQRILSIIDPWPNKQISMQSELDKYDIIFKKHLNL